MSAERQMTNPDYSDQQMRSLAFALVGYMKELGLEERPLTRERAADWTGLSLTTIDRMAKSGRLKAFYVGSTPMYYPSEINKAIKAS